MEVLKFRTTCVYNQETKWLHSGGKASTVPPGGLGIALFEAIKNNAEKGLIAQLESETGTEETYQAFLTKCIKIALYLKDAGVKPGDIISMCSQNNMNNSAVLMATLFTGVILASTDPLLSQEDTKFLLELSEPKLIFVCEKSIDLIQKSSKDIKIVPLYEHETLENVPAILEKYSDNAAKSFEPLFIEDTKSTAMIAFSSGTTGMPKASCLSHEMLASDVDDKQMSGKRVTVFTTLYWSTSTGIAFSVFLAGGVKINIREIDPEDTWACLNKTKCNMMLVSYGHCIQLVPHLNQPMPHLEAVAVGGGLLPLRFQGELKEKLPKSSFIFWYGLTEIGSVTINVGQSPPDSPGHIQSKDIILKIVDLNTDEPVDLNEKGEIRVKGKCQLTGYLKKDSKDIWDAEGFYKTGDVGYLNDKYELFVVDRIKEMFKFRGYHVVPEKIERVLMKHPAVHQAVVVGVRHLTDDNHAKALIILKDGCTVDANELVKFTNDKIEDERNHLRAGVQFITAADITYTASTKINRIQLKQKFAN